MAIQQALKSSSAALYAMAGVGDGQSSKVTVSRLVTTVAPPLNDVIQSALIQAGSMITDVTVVHSGLGASGAFEVGYGADTDYFTAAAAAVTGGVVRMSAATAQPLILTENDTVDVRITGLGATAAVTFSIIVTYVPLNN